MWNKLKGILGSYKEILEVLSQLSDLRDEVAAIRQAVTRLVEVIREAMDEEEEE